MEVCAVADAHPAVKAPLAAIDSHLRQAIRALRSIIKDLAPEALERGLIRLEPGSAGMRGMQVTLTEAGADFLAGR